MTETSYLIHVLTSDPGDTCFSRLEKQLARDLLADRFSLREHLAKQRSWSAATFGPGERRSGVVDHIRKELVEVEESGALEEWIDVVILALDGAWRSGASPDQIIEALAAKQARNEKREWPDWRTADPNKAIEHVRARQSTPPADVQDAGGET